MATPAKPRKNGKTGGPSRSDKARRKNRDDSTPIRYCPATTKAGNSCTLICPVVRIRGKRYHLKTCAGHASPAIRREMGLDGRHPNNPHPGRKKVIRSAADIMRERFEADADRYLQPLEEALVALKAVVVGNGASAYIETIEDYSVRLRALEVLLDRVYGKPKQVNEFSGPDGTPFEVVVPSSRDRQLDVAKVLAEVGALGNVQPVLSVPENSSANDPSSN